MLAGVWEALYTGAGFFWKAFWALGLGYGVSVGIQVFVSRRQAAAHLGQPGVGSIGLGMLLGIWDRLGSATGWRRVGRAYRMEWAMVWKDLAVGFTVAGVVAALVPAAFFEAILPTGWPTWAQLPVQALLAPVLAVLTFIGSMGDGPLAAVLAGHGVVFGAIMAFLYADFVVPPALRINARYCGWRFAGYLAVVFAASAVVAGVAVHALFAALGLLPGAAKPATEMATFAVDYTFWLNVATIAVAAVLFTIGRRLERDAADRAGADQHAQTVDARRGSDDHRPPPSRGRNSS